MYIVYNIHSFLPFMSWPPPALCGIASWVLCQGCFWHLQHRCISSLSYYTLCPLDHLQFILSHVIASKSKTIIIVALSPAKRPTYMVILLPLRRGCLDVLLAWQLSSIRHGCLDCWRTYSMKFAITCIIHLELNVQLQLFSYSSNQPLYLLQRERFV